MSAKHIERQINIIISVYFSSYFESSIERLVKNDKKDLVFD
jgi:hypothetical protein